MAKKKVKKVSKSTSKKSYGELFDKHNNLIWLLPIFFIVAAVAVLVIKNMDTNSYSVDNSIVDEKIMIEDEDLNVGTESGQSLIEDEAMIAEEVYQ